MSRSFDERIALYFVKNISTATLFLLVMAMLFIGVGYSRGLTNAYFLIGILLFVLWIWQLIRTVFSEVKGSQVDASADKFRETTNLIKNAYTALNVSEEDMKEAQMLRMDGYCCLPIETEPLFRWDEEEQKARSSNYQLTCFFLDKGLFLTYTEVKSLVDTEFYEGSHIWRFAGITDVIIEKIPHRCRITNKRDSEKVEKEFDVLTIIGENGERLSYAIGEGQMETAEYIREEVMGTKQTQSKLRKPVRKAQPKQIVIDYDSLDKREKNALQVGMIGDDMGDI